MTSDPPPAPGGDEPAPARGWTDVRFRWWNLLLLVPLISLVTPLFNRDEPTLGGLPFFYWFQLLVIPVGVLCTLTVHLMTRAPGEQGGDAAASPSASTAGTGTTGTAGAAGAPGHGRGGPGAGDGRDTPGGSDGDRR